VWQRRVRFLNVARDQEVELRGEVGVHFDAENPAQAPAAAEAYDVAGRVEIACQPGRLRHWGRDIGVACAERSDGVALAIGAYVAAAREFNAEARR
jgi:hypothetical protein